MSLLITSNTALSSEGSNSIGLNIPSSYVNNLNGVLTIPPNSEIAVQSVKINKTGNITIPEGGLNFGFYFGRGFNYDTSNDYYKQTSFMTPISVGEDNESLSVEQLASKSAIALNKILWHPNLLENASTGRNAGASCIVQRNASLDLVGFKFTVTNSASTQNESNLPGTWRAADFSGGGFNKIGNELSADATNDSPINIIGESFPLSLAEGEFNCSLGNSSTSEWSVGLSRCLRPDFGYEPSYFNNRGGDDYFDYVVKQVEEGANHNIRLYHAVSCGATGDLCTEMVEINYGAVLDGIVETISNVTWKIEAEQVICKLIKADASVITLCTGTSATSASNAKPVNMMCRTLYPKVTLEPDKNVKITGYTGVNVKDFIYGDVAVGGTINAGPYLYKDYWAYLENTDQIADIALDFELGNVNNGFPTNTEGFTGQTGTTLSTGKINYPTDGILLGFGVYKGTTDTGEGTGFKFSSTLNSARVFGFSERNIAPTTTVLNPLSWISSEIPIIKNTNSLFVRLKNMTFDSANFSTSNMSKILYHIPAFSNNGESTGSLFFEPSERVYLKLNNPYEINMTTIEVDIVNSNETISQDLLGKSVVVFHIKDSK